MKDLERGAIVVRQGEQWRVTGSITANGKTDYSLVRVGSLAERVIFGEEEEK